MESEGLKSSNELAQERTQLAVNRTLMAASRSLMAWVRTGLSMIGFGFTIYKFLSSSPSIGVQDSTPRDLGIFLLTLGITSILFGGIEYWQTLRELRQNYRGRFRKYPLILALLIGGLGIALLIQILLKRL
jgi:putative membrane protein